MKVLALTALILATTTVSGVSASSLAGITGSSHTRTTTSVILPKCFPDCGDGD
jgi:hypothetical protein